MAAETKEVEFSIECKLNSFPKSLSINRCIYKVPEHIRKVNRECYHPSIVSIGPIYYNTPFLEASSMLKLSRLNCFLEYATYTNGNQAFSLGQYIDIMKEWEEEARSYYEEKVSLTSNEFVEMMMVDAAFIIYTFMCHKKRHFHLLQEIPMFEKVTWMGKVIQDLFVEDNQLPFFVLKNLYDIAFGAAYPHISFKELTCSFISRPFFLGNDRERTKLGRENVENNTSCIKHLVDFMRVWHLPPEFQDNNEMITNELNFPPSVEKLMAAGVKFEVREGKNLLDIEFSNGVLKIPRLVVEDSMEGFIRNIIFYEQSHYYPNGNSYFADYVLFLDALIDTREDVQILVQHGIMENCVGSNDDVATIVNRLTKYISIHRNYYYYDISQRLNAHANAQMNKWMAILRKDYFNHPWSITSVVYLVVMLILTVLQVYTGFKS